MENDNIFDWTSKDQKKVLSHYTSLNKTEINLPKLAQNKSFYVKADNKQ